MGMVRELTQKIGALQLHEATSEAKDNNTPNACAMCIAMGTACIPNCSSIVREKRVESRVLVEFAPCKMCIKAHTECSLSCASKRWEQKKLLKQSRRDHADDGEQAEGALMTPEKIPRPLQQVGEGAGASNNAKVPLLTGGLPPRPVREAPRPARDLGKEKPFLRATQNEITKGVLMTGGLTSSLVQDQDAGDRWVAGVPASRIEECVLVFYDFETTGGIHEGAITEIAAQRIHYKDGSWVRDGEALEFFVNPGRRIPAFITQLTGITDAMVRDAVSVEEGLAKFQAYIAESAPRPTIPMAHNGKAFDRQFVRYKWPKSIRGDFDPPNVEYWGDSISLFKLLIPGRFQKYKLGTLYDSLNGPKSNAHRALDDVRMMEFCINSLWSSRVNTFDSRLETLYRLAGKKTGAPPDANLTNNTVFKLYEDK